jgi:hypothetical protein
MDRAIAFRLVLGKEMGEYNTSFKGEIYEAGSGNGMEAIPKTIPILS